MQRVAAGCSGLQRVESTGGVGRHAAGSAAAWADGLAVRCLPSKSTEQTRPGTPIWLEAENLRLEAL